MCNVKRSTIKDVAKAAGVSTATVSRALNHSDYPVRTELRELVLKTAKRLNYIPNRYGKLLKTGVSNDIGVIIPSLSNPFYAETVSGIELECRLRGYSPVFCSSNNDLLREKKYMDDFLTRSVAGILVSTINEEALKFYQTNNSISHVVLFDQTSIDCGCTNVAYDFHQAGVMAAEYLIKKGHRDIAVLSEPFDRASRKARFDGFFETLEQHGIYLHKSRLFINDFKEYNSNTGLFEFDNGCALAKSFLEARCPSSAIVATNDITAIGIINVISKNGFRIPEDISIIGFDDINFSAMTTPSLTTVHQPSFEMGKAAVRLLIEKISSKTVTSIILTPNIVERGSVKDITNHTQE